MIHVTSPMAESRKTYLESSCGDHREGFVIFKDVEDNFLMGSSDSGELSTSFLLWKTDYIQYHFLIVGFVL